MGTVKNFLKNHFEKIGLGVAVLIAALILLKAFSGGQIEQLIQNIDELLDVIGAQMKTAEVEGGYNPKKIPEYDKQILDTFESTHKGKGLAERKWVYPRRMLIGETIVIKTSSTVALDKTFSIDPPKAKSVTTSNAAIGVVTLPDPGRLRIVRKPGMAGGEAMLQIIYQDETLEFRSLVVTVIEKYIPQMPIRLEGKAVAGMNRLKWATHPRDFDNVIGFDVFRKGAENKAFGLKPLNRELVEPLDHVPEFEDEQANEEDQAPVPEPVEKKEAVEGEEMSADAEQPVPPPVEEKFPFLLRGRNRGAEFTDRNITPLEDYWYAVRTVARRTVKNDAGEKIEEIVKSGLCELIKVTSADQTRLIFKNILGEVEDPAGVRAIVEVHKFVKVRWISHPFVVKIGNRIGGKVWADVPTVDRETGEVRAVGKTFDFTSKYVLVDVMGLEMWEPFERIKIVKDPETGRLVEKTIIQYRKVKAFQIIINPDDGSNEKLLMERYKHLLPDKPVVKALEGEKAPVMEGPEREEDGAPFGGRIE